MTDRAKLAQAIIAFDIIFSDILMDMEDGKEPHPIASLLMDSLIEQISFGPGLHELTEQFIINMADMSARIRLMTMAMEVDENQVRRVIEMQKVRLAQLGKQMRPAGPLN